MRLLKLGVFLLMICLNRVASGIEPSVEYMFKMGEETEYGLLKEDLKPNGVACIIRLSSNESVQPLLDPHNYFTIKKFLPGFYMVRLSTEIQHLFNDSNHDSSLQLKVNIFQGSQIIHNLFLKFLLVRTTDLQLKFANSDKISAEFYEKTIEISEEFGVQTNPYGGPVICKVQLDTNSSLIRNYSRDLVLISLINTSDFFIFDPLSGLLRIAPGFYLDRERNEQFRLNISLSDTRKLFKSAYLSLIIKILDLNDTKPTSLLYTYNISVSQSAWSNNKMIPLIDRTLISSKVADCSVVKLLGNTADFQIVASKLWMRRRIRVETPIIDYYELEIKCQDGENKLSAAKINLKVKLTESDEDSVVKEINYLNETLNEKVTGTVRLFKSIDIYNLDLSSFGVDLRAGIRKCFIDQIEIDNRFVKHLNLHLGHLNLIIDSNRSKDQIIIQCHLDVHETYSQKLNLFIRFIARPKLEHKYIEMRVARDVFDKKSTLIGSLPVELDETIMLFQIIEDSSKGLVEIDGGVLRTQRVIQNLPSFIRLKVKVEFFGDDGLSILRMGSEELEVAIEITSPQSNDFEELRELEKLVKELNLTKFDFRIKSLDQSRVVCVLNTTKRDFKYEVTSLFELDAFNGTKSKIPNRELFKVENRQLMYKWPIENKLNSVFWLELKICSLEMRANCRRVEFLVQVKLQLGVDQIKFESNDVLVQVRPMFTQMRQIIDIKSLLRNHSAFNFAELSIRFKIDLDQGDIDLDPKMKKSKFLFDESSGVLFQRDIVNRWPVLSARVETKQGIVISSCTIKIEEESINSDQIKIEIDNFKSEIINLIKLENFSSIEVICVEVSQRQCRQIFSYSPMTNFLILNSTAFNKAFKYIHKSINNTLNLIVFHNQSRVHTVSLLLELASWSSKQIFQPMVYVLKGHGPWVLKINYSRVNRVLDLLDNVKASSIDYHINKDNLVIDYMASNKLFSFESNNSAPFYVFTYDSFVRTRKITVEIDLAEILNERRLITSLNLNNHEIKRRFFLIHRIRSNSILSDLIEVDLNGNLVLKNSELEIKSILSTNKETIDLDIYSIEIDDLSHTIDQVESLEVSLTLVKKEKELNEVFYQRIELKKSQLNVEGTGYAVAFHDLGPGEFEISEEYYNLSIELNNGKMFYLASEEAFVEKEVPIEIKLGSNLVSRIDLALVDDDPIVITQGIIFRFKSNKLVKNSFIGFIDILAKLRQLDQLGPVEYEYELRYEMNLPGNNNFYLDETSGALFVLEERIETLSLFRVSVCGRVNRRPVNINALVSVSVESSVEMSEFVFEEIMVRPYLNGSHLAPTWSISNEALFFKPSDHGDCEVALFGGQIACQSSPSIFTSFPVISYQTSPSLMKLFKVNISKGYNCTLMA